MRKFIRYGSIFFFSAGLILLLGKNEWFPEFYHPIFMGTVFVLFPVLVYLPPRIFRADNPEKKQTQLKIQAIIALSLLFNNLGELGFFKLYDLFGFEYDKVVHFSVSLLLSWGYGEFLRLWKKMGFKKIARNVFLTMFLAGIGWEVLEIIADMLFKTHEWGIYGEYVKRDTVLDLFFNTLGIFAGITLLRFKKGTMAEKIRI